jgi:hypothetical protein
MSYSLIAEYAFMEKAPQNDSFRDVSGDGSIHKFSLVFARRFAEKLCFSGPEPRHAVVFNLPDKKIVPA